MTLDRATPSWQRNGAATGWSRGRLGAMRSGPRPQNSAEMARRAEAEVGVLSGTTGRPGVPLQHLLRVPTMGSREER